MNPILAGFGHIDRSAKINIDHLHNDCMELFAYFNFKLVEALVKSTRLSLDLLKKRVGSSRFVQFCNDDDLITYTL